MFEDASSLLIAPRVGNRTVEHPRARKASAMLDALGDATPSDLTADELATCAARVGMQDDGTARTCRLHNRLCAGVTTLARHL